jgi:hypothetical protein
MNGKDVLNKQWYNASNGQWQNQWWNSANAATTLADLADINPDYLDEAKTMLAEVFTNAKTANGGDWLNGFYDDESW